MTATQIALGAGQGLARWPVPPGYKPLTDEAVLRRMDKGEIAPDSLVWQAGMSDWQRADEAMPLVAKRVEAALTHPKPPARIGKAFALYASLR